MNETEQTACAFLPRHLSDSVRRTAALYSAPTEEIRLRLGQKLTLTVSGKNVPCGAVCSARDITETVLALCQGSVYSFEEAICEGVIPTSGGIRAGVSGRATVRAGKVTAVSGFSSVSIRIPHRVRGAADGLYETVKSAGSVLVFSPPGGGKTTALRELIPRLSSPDGFRVAVVDTRYELCAVQRDAPLCDWYLGYPRHAGMTAAVRTMTPDYLICDEIAGEDDADAILYAHAAGVKVVCSAHGRTRDELNGNPTLARLLQDGVFGALYEVRRI